VDVISQVISALRGSASSPSGSNAPMIAVRDAQQERMLERLRQAGRQPVSFAELRARGIEFPAVVLTELELSGYAIERVHDGGRLTGVCLLDF
jgi:hypothetical protein